jgi:hypothetical protein
VAAYAFAPLWATGCIAMTPPEGWRCERSASVARRPADPTGVEPPDCRPQRIVSADGGRVPGMRSGEPGTDTARGRAGRAQRSPFLARRRFWQHSMGRLSKQYIEGTGG